MGKKRRRLPRCIWKGIPPCPICPVLLQCGYGNRVVNTGKQSSHLIELADEHVKRRMDKSNEGEPLPNLRED